MTRVRTEVRAAMLMAIMPVSVLTTMAVEIVKVSKQQVSKYQGVVKRYPKWYASVTFQCGYLEYFEDW